MRHRIFSKYKYRLLLRLSAIGIFSLSALIGGCQEKVSPPPSSAPKTLPATWTPGEAEIAALTAEAIQTTSSPELTHTLPPTQTQTPVPSENWWAVSFGKLRQLRIRYGMETSDGGYLFLAQAENQAGDIVRDLIIKINASGGLSWEKSIYPETARVHGLQDLDNGTLLFYGYYEYGEFPLAPFFITITEDGEIVSQKEYLGHYFSTKNLFLNYFPGGPSASIGKLSLSGNLPGNYHIFDYAVLPNGDTTMIGFFSDTIVAGGGGSFSVNTAIWALRFDQENQILWQRFFKSRFGPWFFGSILPNGSVVMLKNSSYDYDSIIKLDPDGYTEYWKHYSSIYAFGLQTLTSDGGIILTGNQRLLKLDSKGEIVNSIQFINDQDKLFPSYAFETSDGDLILVAQSKSHGTTISRFNISSPFPDCPILTFVEQQLEEFFPLPPYNISGSIRAKPYTTNLDEGDYLITLEEDSPDWYEICRFRDPNPDQE